MLPVPPTVPLFCVALPLLSMDGHECYLWDSGWPTCCLLSVLGDVLPYRPPHPCHPQHVLLSWGKRESLQVLQLQTWGRGGVAASLRCLGDGEDLSVLTLLHSVEGTHSKIARSQGILRFRKEVVSMFTHCFFYRPRPCTGQGCLTAITNSP